MAKLNRVVSRELAGKNQYKLVINLDEMFGTLVPNSSRFRQAVGQAILDKIVDRTRDDRKSWKGSSFKGYSEEYAESLEGAVAGKSTGETANLTNSGDMLNLMDIISEGQSTIEIGWTESDEAEKAHGHISGNVGVTRDFFGISVSELEDIRTDLEPLRQSLVEDNPAGEVESSVSTLQSLIEGERSVPDTTTTLGGLLRQFFGGGDNDV